MFTTLTKRIRQTQFTLTPTEQALEWWENLARTLTLQQPEAMDYDPYMAHITEEGCLEVVWLDEREPHHFSVDLTACYLRHQASNPAIFYSLMQLHAKAGTCLDTLRWHKMTLSRTNAERLILAWGFVEHAAPENLNTLCHALIWMDEAQVRTFWEFALHYGMSGRNPTPLYQGLEAIIMGLVSDNR